MRKKTAKSPFRTPTKPIIAVALAAFSELELAFLDGVRAFAASRKSWEILVLTGGYEAPLRQAAEAGLLAGAMGDFVSDAWMSDACFRGVQVVQWAHLSFLHKVVNVAPDYQTVGAEAAEALIRNGSRTFGFLGVSGQYASREYERGFIRQLQTGGRSAKSSTATSAAILQDFLGQMATPAGLFASSDRLARLAIQVAGTLGKRVPEDLAVIGVGDQRLESLAAGVPISSFALPGRETGLGAARLLDDLLAGTAVDTRLHPISSRAVLHERRSSLRRPGGLARAVAYAKTHLDQPLQVGDLARAAGMSRRALETAFQSERGESPGMMLRRLRQDHAEGLLRGGKMRIEEVGRACGFAEVAAFSAAFKRWTGVGPREFRLNGRR